MEKTLTDVNGYKVIAEVQEVPNQQGMYCLKFKTQYDNTKNPSDTQTKFETYLTWSQLKEFKALLP